MKVSFEDSKCSLYILSCDVLTCNKHSLLLSLWKGIDPHKHSTTGVDATCKAVPLVALMSIHRDFTFDASFLSAPVNNDD
jgi:hypothetical protein